MALSTKLSILVGDMKGQTFSKTMTLDEHYNEDKQTYIVRLLDTTDDKAIWQDFVLVPVTRVALSMCKVLEPQEDGYYITDVEEPKIIQQVVKCCESVDKGLTPAFPCKDATSFFDMARCLQAARALGVDELQQRWNKAFLDKPPIKLLLRDGSLKEIPSDVMRMCDTLIDLQMDCEDMKAIPVPIDDVEALDDIIEFCTDIILGVDRVYDLWIDRVMEWPRERLFGMSNASDFLNNQCAMEVCAKAIAKVMTGMKVEQMRDYLGIAQEQ